MNSDGTPDTATFRRAKDWVSKVGIVLCAASIFLFVVAGGWGMVAVQSVALAFFVYTHERRIESPEN